MNQERQSSPRRPRRPGGRARSSLPSAGSTSLSAADGFYLMLAPLRPGQHTLHFGGTFGDPINFTLDITYHLTVQGTTEATPVRTVTWGALKTIYR